MKILPLIDGARPAHLVSMNHMSIQNRQPSGVPSGGQFAIGARSEPPAGLIGNVSVPAPARLRNIARELVTSRDGGAPSGGFSLVATHDEDGDQTGWEVCDGNAAESFDVDDRVGALRAYADYIDTFIDDVPDDQRADWEASMRAAQVDAAAIETSAKLQVALAAGESWSGNDIEDDILATLDPDVLEAPEGLYEVTSEVALEVQRAFLARDEYFLSEGRITLR